MIDKISLMIQAKYSLEILMYCEYIQTL